MKLNRATLYAFHALAYLSQLDGELRPSNKIAQERQIPERFLLKVLKPLVDIGVLDSVKGPHGGYKLVRPLDEISVLEVTEAVSGPINGGSRLPQLGAEGIQSASVDARLADFFEEESHIERQRLNGISLAQLLLGKTPARKKKR